MAMLPEMSGAPLVKRLDLVFYWVADMERAVGFYRDVLGLLLVRRDADSWAQFDAGGRQFALHGAGDQSIPPGGATAVFAVRDLDEAIGALSQQGVRPEHQGDVEGYARFASFLDPDGNTFQLIEYVREQAEPGQELQGVH